MYKTNASQYNSPAHNSIVNKLCFFSNCVRKVLIEVQEGTNGILFNISTRTESDTRQTDVKIHCFPLEGPVFLHQSCHHMRFMFALIIPQSPREVVT